MNIGYDPEPHYLYYFSFTIMEKVDSEAYF